MILLGVVWLVLGGLLALGLHVRLAGIGRSTAEFTDRQLPPLLMRDIAYYQAASHGFQKGLLAWKGARPTELQVGQQ